MTAKTALIPESTVMMMALDDEIVDYGLKKRQPTQVLQPFVPMTMIEKVISCATSSMAIVLEAEGARYSHA